MFAAFVTYDSILDAFGPYVGTLLGSYAFGCATLKGGPAVPAFGGRSGRAGGQPAPVDAPTLRLVFGLGRP